MVRAAVNLDLTADPRDFEIAFKAAGRARAEAAVLLVWGPVLNPHRTEIAALAVKSRIPTIYREREQVEAGGLIAYGPNIPDLFKRAALYVDPDSEGRQARRFARRAAYEV